MNFSCDLGSVNMDPTQLAQFNSTNDSNKNHDPSDGVKTEVTSFRDEYEWSFANIPFNEAPIATAPIAEAYDKYSIMHSPLAVAHCLGPTIPFHDDDDSSLLSLPADTLAPAASIHPRTNISYMGTSVSTSSPSVNVSQGPSPSKVNIAVSSSTAVSPATDITTIPGNITPPRADHDHFPPEQLWATSSVEGGSTITSPTSVATGGLSPPYHDISTSPYPDFDAKAYIAAGVDPSSHPLANPSYGASASMPLGSVVAPVTMRMHNTGSPALDAHGKMLGLGSTNPYRHSPTLALSTLLPQASQGLATANMGTGTGASTAQVSSRSYSYSYNPTASHDNTTHSTSASTSASTTTPAVGAGTGATHAPMAHSQGNGLGTGTEHGMGASGSGMGNNATYGAMPGYLFSTGNSMYNHGNNAGTGMSANTGTGYSAMVPSAAPSAVPSAVTTPNPGVNGVHAQRHAGMGTGMGVGTNGMSMSGAGGYMYGTTNGMGGGTMHARPTTHSSFFDPSTNTHTHMYGQNTYTTPQNAYNAHQGGYTMSASNGSVSGMGYRSSFADGTSTAASLASHRHSFGDVAHTSAAHHSPTLAHSHHRSAFDVNPGTAPSVAAMHRSSFADGTVTALPSHMLGGNGMGMGVDGGITASDTNITNASAFTEPTTKKTTTTSTGNRRSTRAVKAPPSTQDSIYAASASSPLTDTPLRGPSKNKKGANATNATASASTVAVANTNANTGGNDGAGMGYQGMGGMGGGGKGMSMGMGSSQPLRMQGMAHMGMGNLNMSTTMQMHNHMHSGMTNSVNANNGMGAHAEMVSDNSPQGEEDSSSDYDEGEWESARKYGGSSRNRGTARHSSAITEASLQAAYNAANDSDIDEFLESKKGQRLSKKDRNKLSAMKYRKKRKMFVVELEDKVEQLETHIQQQTDQISFLQGENGRLLALLASVGIVDPGPAKKTKPSRKESTGTGSTSVKKRAMANKDNGRDTTVTLGMGSSTGAGAVGGKGISRSRNNDTSTLASGSAVLFILFSLFMFLTPMLLDVSDMDPKPPVIHTLTPNALSSAGISQEFPIMSNFPVQPTNSVSAATLLREVDMLVHDIDAYSTGKNSNARNSENSHRELVHQSRILLMHLREELDHEVSQANEGGNDGEVSDTDAMTPLVVKVHNDSVPASNDVAEDANVVAEGVKGKDDSVRGLRDSVASSVFSTSSTPSSFFSSSPFLFSTWFLDITAWIQSANMLAKWFVICWHVFVPIVVVIFAEKVGLALFIRQLLGIARCEDNNGYCIASVTHAPDGDVDVEGDVEVDGSADEADEEDVRDRESYVSQYTKSRRSPYPASREYSANVNCNDMLSMDSPFASLCSSPDCSNCSVSDSELAGVPSRRRMHHHGTRHDPIRIATGACDADDYPKENIKGGPEMTNPEKPASECAYSMKKLPEPQAISGNSPTNKWSESSETTDEEETWKEYTLWDSDSDNEEGEKSPEATNKNTLAPENYHEHCIVAKV